jgi:hypothetical protein
MLMEDKKTALKKTDINISKDRRYTGARNKFVPRGSSFPVSLTEVYYSTLMLEAAISSETLVHMYKSKPRHVPEDSNRYCHGLGILTSHLKKKSNCSAKHLVFLLLGSCFMTLSATKPYNLEC